MKRYLPIIHLSSALFMLAGFVAHGQTFPRIGYAGILITNCIGAGTIGSGGGSYLIDEDCEGTGTPSGWTDAATPAWDYTTTALAGSQSLFLNGSSEYSVKATGSTNGELWGYCKVLLSAAPATDNYIFTFQDASSANIGFFMVQTSLVPRAYNGTQNGSGSALSTNTTYHMWIHYTKGTGANGSTYVYTSTNGVKPDAGSWLAAVANGNATTDVTKLIVAGNASGVILDDMRVSASSIGDNGL